MVAFSARQGALTEDGELKQEGRYAIAAKDARSLRSKFLPHLYTLIYKCSTTGDMIVRPLPFEFPGEPQALGYSTQFILGKHVMVVPKTQHQELLESQRASNTTLHTFPPTPLYVPRGTWYEWSSWRRVESRGSVMFMPSTNTSHPRLFVREGGIVVTRCKSSELSRNETRAMPGATFLELTVCLDAADTAEGELIVAPREKDAPSAHPIDKNTHFRFFYARVLTVKRILHVMTTPFVMKVT
ncbi:hypothetical protein HPB50_006118 [Hyalomma asiaticum]|uniref:Uncharacterized protein n=1 Tax=Hyalomma asiaticum TaxID=266040 RepID=A0ACB7T8J1_HYAAI|nr:hypothetical protein HPB50_006118 [Hyalomma asiaticum]